MSPAPSLKPCPLCDRPATAEHAPFCSHGCRDRDLLRWLGEGYAIPARAGEAEDVDDSERLDRREPGPL